MNTPKPTPDAPLGLVWASACPWCHTPLDRGAMAFLGARGGLVCGNDACQLAAARAGERAGLDRHVD